MLSTRNLSLNMWYRVARDVFDIRCLWQQCYRLPFHATNRLTLHRVKACPQSLPERKPIRYDDHGPCPLTNRSPTIRTATNIMGVPNHTIIIKKGIHFYILCGLQWVQYVPSVFHKYHWHQIRITGELLCVVLYSIPIAQMRLWRFCVI